MMKTIQATWKDGVFTPDAEIDLAEGTQVNIQITDPVEVNVEPATAAPPSSEPFVSEDQEIILGSPLLSGEKINVKFVGSLKPDPNSLME